MSRSWPEAEQQLTKTPRQSFPKWPKSTIAKTTAFANSKEELQVQLEQGGEEIVKQALEAVEHDMPEEADQKIIEKTPVGKQYYEIYEKVKSELMSYIQ